MSSHDSLFFDLLFDGCVECGYLRWSAACLTTLSLSWLLLNSLSTISLPFNPVWPGLHLIMTRKPRQERFRVHENLVSSLFFKEGC